MALYTLTSKDDFARLNRLPSSDQTQLYNALGRDAGAGNNFFARRAKSIDNAIGTTGAAIAGAAKDAWENLSTQTIRQDNKDRMNKIAKKYGYNTYQDVWDARDAAQAAGDQVTLDKIDNVINPELQNQANINAQRANEKAANYADYMQNNDVSKRINQDPGKFAGSAINTLSTAFDVMAPGAGVLANSVQGGIEGIADELEQSGLQNFNAERAAQNALVGTATGAVVGGLNKGVTNSLAKRGGNLFKGSNAITRGLNNLGSKTAAGRVGSTLATGAARGALSGAVGGATGAGLSAALNNQDVLGSALQGVSQGLQQGALAGGVMAGANMALSKTPIMQKINQANEDWKNSGENFKERWQNTREQDTWGNRLIDNTKARLQNGALSIKDASVEMNNANPMDYMPKDTNAAVQKFLDTLTPEGQIPTEGYAYGKNASARREAIASLRNEFTDGELATLMNNETNPKLKALYADAGGQNPSSELTDWGQVIKELDAEGVPFTSPRYQAAWEEYTKRYGSRNRASVENSNTNDFDYIFEDARGNRSRLPELRQTLNPDGNTVVANSDLIDSPIRGRMYDRMSNDDFINYAEQNGWKLVKTPYEGMSGSEMLNTMARNAGFDDYDAATRRFTDTGESTKGTDIVDWMERLATQRQATPETEMYRTLTGETEQKPFLAYGESDLASGKASKRNILSKAGRAMQAAQANATRKETRDIGIESAGELINKVRQRSGLSDIEKQAAFAKELTGGENSLLDAVQRNAISATEDGLPRTVNLDAVTAKVNKLIDDLPNTLVNQNQKETVRNAVMADLTNGNIDTITKANNFKAAAAQQFLINERTPNDSAKALGVFYTKVGDLVDDASYSEIPSTQVEAMFDAAASEATARAKIAGDNGKTEYQKAYSQLATELKESPKTMQAYRSLKKDYVDINKLNKKTQQGATAWNNSPLVMGTAITTAMATGNPLIAVPAAWAAKTLAPAVGQVAIDASASLGGKLADWGDNLTTRRSGRVASAPTEIPTVPNTSYNPATQLYNAIGRTEGLTNGEQARTANYISDAVQEANGGTLESLVGTPATGATSVYDSVYSTPTASATTGKSNSYFQATGDYWTDILGAALTSAIQDGDVDAFGPLYSMYQDALSKQGSSKDYSNPMNWSSSDRSDLLKAQNGLDQIDSLAQSYANAVGESGGNVVQGTLRGWANNLSGGNLDPAAENYVKQANSIGAGIIKNLVNLGSTEYDAARYVDYLPKLTDTKEQAAQKLQVLKDAYQNVINNLYALYGA